MATNGVPGKASGSYMQSIIDDTFQHQPGYAHYKSVKFRIEVCYSGAFLCYILQQKVWPRRREWGVSNTPIELAPGQKLSVPMHHGVGGPDEDFYISIAEGYWF